MFILGIVLGLIIITAIRERYSVLLLLLTWVEVYSYADFEYKKRFSESTESHTCFRGISKEGKYSAVAKVLCSSGKRESINACPYPVYDIITWL